MRKLDNEDKFDISQKMIEHLENWEKIRYRGGRPKIAYITVGIKELCNLYNINKKTLTRWIHSGKLNPQSLFSICSLFSTLFSGHER